MANKMDLLLLYGVLIMGFHYNFMIIILRMQSAIEEFHFHVLRARARTFHRSARLATAITYLWLQRKTKNRWQEKK